MARKPAEDLEALFDKHGVDKAVIAERVWSKIDKRAPDQCWPWVGAMDEGYGRLRVHTQGRPNRKFKDLKGHRLVYWLVKGNPDVTLDVRHLCNNRVCCNPAHLELGTHAENMHDVVLAETHRAENNPNAKLTREDVEFCKRMRAEGWTLKALGAHFAVHLSTIDLAVRGKSWARDVPTPPLASNHKVTSEAVKKALLEQQIDGKTETKEMEELKSVTQAS